MRALRAVEEVDIDVHGLAVAGQPCRQAARDLVETEGAIALGARCPLDLVTRPGRHEHLRLEPGGLHLRRLAHLRRQHALGDEEDVAVEADALVTGPHLGHDAVDPHDLAVRKDAIEGHDVVELQVRALLHAHPELERRRILPSDSSPDPCPLHAPGVASLLPPHAGRPDAGASGPACA